MRKREARQKIIWALGQEAKPLIIHAIAKKAGYTDPAVLEAIRGEKGLETQNIVKKYSEKPWKAGGKNVEYALTFHGLIEYLDLIFNNPKDRIPEVKKVIQSYNKFSKVNYPLFEHSDFLAKNGMGNSVYESFVIAAVLSKKSPPQTWVNFEGISGDLAGIIRWLEKEKKRQVIRLMLPEKEDKLWMHTFTLLFLDLTEKGMKEKIKRAENKTLWEFIEKTLREDTKAQKDRLNEVQGTNQRMKTTFEEIFAPIHPSLRRK